MSRYKHPHGPHQRHDGTYKDKKPIQRLLPAGNFVMEDLEVEGYRENDADTESHGAAHERHHSIEARYDDGEDNHDRKGEHAGDCD